MIYTSVFLGFLAASEALNVGVAVPRATAVAASKISMQVAAEAQVAQPVALAKVCQRARRPPRAQQLRHLARPPSAALRAHSG